MLCASQKEKDLTVLSAGREEETEPCFGSSASLKELSLESSVSKENDCSSRFLTNAVWHVARASTATPSRLGAGVEPSRVFIAARELPIIARETSLPPKIKPIWRL